MPRSALHTRLLLAAMCAAAGGCTTFSSVRSAEVREGPSVTLQGSLSTPPGDEAAWFWSFDCASDCDHPIAAAELDLAWGFTGETPFALGGGVSGILSPYVEGFAQLGGGGGNPYGVGARAGIPVRGWNEYRVFGRYDRRLGNGGRLLLNPELFLHAGNSPNGQNPGSFLAFVQGIGLMAEGRNVSVAPAVSLGVGWSRRRSYGERIGPTMAVFGTASVGVTFHRSRGDAPREDR